MGHDGPTWRERCSQGTAALLSAAAIRRLCPAWAAKCSWVQLLAAHHAAWLDHVQRQRQVVPLAEARAGVLEAPVVHVILHDGRWIIPQRARVHNVPASASRHSKGCVGCALSQASSGWTRQTALHGVNCALHQDLS